MDRNEIRSSMKIDNIENTDTPKHLEYRIPVCGITILCRVIPMGPDYTICIWDERCGHVGTAVLSVARPSLTGEGTSTTTSVLNRMGHKDDEIARGIAEAVAAAKNCTVACTCGIHIDQISPEQIQEILDVCLDLEQRILSDLR